MSEKTDSLVSSLNTLTTEILNNPLPEDAYRMALSSGLALGVAALFQELDCRMREEEKLPRCWAPRCPEVHKDGNGCIKVIDHDGKHTTLGGAIWRDEIAVVVVYEDSDAEVLRYETRAEANAYCSGLSEGVDACGGSGTCYGVVMPYRPYEGGANLQEEFAEHADTIQKAYDRWLAKSST